MHVGDEKQGETGSKMTLFKSDRGATVRVVGVFGDCGKACRRLIGRYKVPKYSKSQGFMTRNGLMTDQKVLFTLVT
jgi:hypothetical protein